MTSLSVTRCVLDGVDHAVVWLPDADAAATAAALSAAERATLELVLAGHSNAAIARARGVSTRTVVNQLGALFRKLGVHSRAELVARLCGADPGAGR